MTIAVRTTDLSVVRGGAVALSGVDVALEAGETMAVIGPNGSGKSTLLETIAGLHSPATGSVSLPLGPPAIVLQATAVDADVPLTVRDAVAMGRYPAVGLLRRFRAVDRELVTSAMERMDLTDLADRPFQELSGGQRQRVLVAQGLAQGAPLLLLDEPVNGLDVTSRVLILDAIEAERAAGRAVVLTTHDLRDAQRCDQVVLLNTGPVAIGSPADVLVEANLAAAFGRQFTTVGGAHVIDEGHHH